MHASKEATRHSYENMDQRGATALIKHEVVYEEIVVKIENEDNMHLDANILQAMETNALPSGFPGNNHFSYCEACQMKFEGECPVHGPAIYVDNAETDLRQRRVADPDASGGGRTVSDKVEQSSNYKGAYFCDQCCLRFTRLELLHRHHAQIHGDVQVKSTKVDSFNSCSISEMTNCEHVTTNLACLYTKDCQERSGDPVNSGHNQTILHESNSKDSDQELFLFGDNKQLSDVVAYFGSQVQYGFEAPISPRAQDNIGPQLEGSVIAPDGDDSTTCSVDEFTMYDQPEENKLLQDGDDSTTCSVDKFKVYDQINGEKIDKFRVYDQTTKDLKKKPAKEKSYTCDFCGAGFSQTGHLKKHIRTHTGEKPYKCDVCGVGFSVDYSLKIHKRTHTGEKPYKCNSCDSSFADGRNLKSHKRTHTGERPYTCDICGSAFSQCSHLKIHRRIHTGEKPFVCDICGMAFADVRRIKRHKRIHTGERPFRCDICGAGFTESSCLNTHIKIHRGENPLKCDSCDAEFVEESSLKQHKRMHTGERHYKCDICEVEFNSRSSLRTHKFTHTGEKPKPHKCDVCGVSFARSSHLKTHKRTHTGERPYKCDVCGMKFTQNGHMRTHKRKHTGERPYKCNVCEVAFAQSSHLETHRRIHTGERPYQCSFCAAAFSDSSSLRKHKKIHIAKNAWNCSIYNSPLPADDEADNPAEIPTEDDSYEWDMCTVSFSQDTYKQAHQTILTEKNPQLWNFCDPASTESRGLIFQGSKLGRNKTIKWDMHNTSSAHKYQSKSSHQRMGTRQKEATTDETNYTFHTISSGNSDTKQPHI